MNIRLDRVTTFENEELAKHAIARAEADYMAIDEQLVRLITDNIDAATSRVIALARTHLESSKFYAIKSIELKHEKRRF